MNQPMQAPPSITVAGYTLERNDHPDARGHRWGFSAHGFGSCGWSNPIRAFVEWRRFYRSQTRHRRP